MTLIKLHGESEVRRSRVYLKTLVLLTYNHSLFISGFRTNVELVAFKDRKLCDEDLNLIR